RRWIARLNMLAKPLVRPLISLAMGGRPRLSLMRSAVADALITLASLPVAGLAFVAICIAAAASSASLQVTVAAAALFLADISTRERRAGTIGLVHSAPFLQPRFVPWKFLSTMIVAASLLAGPLARAALSAPRTLPALIVGIAFLSAAATAF